MYVCDYLIEQRDDETSSEVNMPLINCNFFIYWCSTLWCCSFQKETTKTTTAAAAAAKLSFCKFVWCVNKTILSPIAHLKKVAHCLHVYLATTLAKIIFHRMQNKVQILLSAMKFHEIKLSIIFSVGEARREIYTMHRGLNENIRPSKMYDKTQKKEEEKNIYTQQRRQRRINENRNTGME